MKKFKLILAEARIRSARETDPSLSPYLVSTRLPGFDAENAPTGSGKLTVGMGAYNPEDLPRVANLFTGERGVRVYNLPPHITQNKDPQSVLSAVQRHAEANIEDTLDRAYSLPELAERSAEWYDGAHKIAHRFSKRFNVPHHVASAVLASLSPQNDWYRNVSQAERVMKIHKDHQNTRWSPEMSAVSGKIFKAEDPEHQNLLSEIQGKSLGELPSLKHKAAWVRTYDEAHHPRHHRVVTPEGEFGDYIKTQKGEPAAAAWLNFDTIEKALMALHSGGDMKQISAALGGGHKVRSFYNNILQPRVPKIISATGEDPRDITGDTHHAKVSWADPSVAGTSQPAKDLMGGAPQIKSVGMKGSYPLIGDATRAVADKFGLRPSGVQSITWERVRTDEPSKEQMNQIALAHQEHAAGSISQEELFKRKNAILGKPKIPVWANTGGNPLYTSTFESVKQRTSRLISESLRRRYK